MTHGLNLYNAAGNLTFTTQYGTLVAYSVVTIPAGQTIDYTQISYPELTGGTIGIYGDWVIMGLCNPTIDYPGGEPRLTLSPAGPITMSVDVSYTIYIAAAPPTLATGYGALVHDVTGKLSFSTKYGPYVYAGQATAEEAPRTVADACSGYIAGWGFGMRSRAYFPKNGMTALPLFAVELPTWPHTAGVVYATTDPVNTSQWVVYVASSATLTPVVYMFLPVSNVTPPTPSGHGLALYGATGNVILSTANQKTMGLADWVQAPPLIEPIPQIRYTNYQVGSYPTINYSNQTYDPGHTLPSSGVLSATEVPTFYGLTLDVTDYCFFGQKTNTVECLSRFYGFGVDGNLIKVGYFDYPSIDNYNLCGGSKKSWDGGRSTASGSTAYPWKSPMLLIDKGCTL